MSVQALRETHTIAAIFQSEHQARKAVRELEQLGYPKAWVGIVRAHGYAEHLPIVDSADGGGVFEALGRMFGGEGDRSLHSVLTSHGIPNEQARELVGQVGPNSAVLTVDIHEVPTRALETIMAYGGDIGNGDTAPHTRRERVIDSAAVFL